MYRPSWLVEFETEKIPGKQFLSSVALTSGHLMIELAVIFEISPWHSRVKFEFGRKRLIAEALK